MGLDANVMCNCYKDGLDVPAEFCDLIYLDDEGYLDLRVSYDDNEELYTSFDLWVRDTCPHEDMDFACERIANWGGVSSFKRVLKSNNSERFKTLLSEIPEANGGKTAPESARKILNELDLFDELEVLEKTFVLLDCEEGTEIWQSSEETSSTFVISGEENIILSLDKDGFFIAKDDEVLFQSKEFLQELLEPNKTERWEDGKVKYIDIVSGMEFVCYSTIPGEQITWPNGSWENEKGQVRFSFPRHYCTKYREDTPGEYSYITESLRTICEASVKTGNPIRWT